MASDAFDDSKEWLQTHLEDGKKMASDAYDATAEKQANLKAAAKAYEACVKMKSKWAATLASGRLFNLPAKTHLKAA